MLNTHSWILLPAFVVLSGCTTAPPAQDTCAGGEGCAPAPRQDSVACSSDLDCPGGLCSNEGLCIETNTCFVTSECPIDRYCNSAMAVPLCAPLPSGACREDSQCGGLRCSALAGGLGACVECLAHGDCASGVCGMDGSCAAQDSTQAIECPPNAHLDGDACVCDEGFALDQTGDACAPPSSTTATSTPEPTTDPCEQAGLYGDGHCDDGCQLPDPDCDAPAEDICAEYDWYGDGYCDEECAQPDPDCDLSAGGPCGDETYYGRCEGDLLIYCDDGELRIDDCTEEGGFCDLYSYQEGYFCILPG